MFVWLLSLYLGLIYITVFFAQNARFVIVEGYGCSSSLLGTWVAVVIVSVLPILLELIAGVYGCLSIRSFYKRRSEVNESLSSHQNLNSSRYIRLMFFSFCDLLVGIPITVLFLYLNTRTTLLPFPGLTREHHHFSRVIQVPAVVWRASTLLELAVELNRWIVVWGAFVFFAIFGFTKESRNNYRAVLQSVVQVFMRIMGIKTRPSTQPEGCVSFSCSLFDILLNILIRITFKAATRELDTVDSNLVV
jgi:pheromone a factor receptor